MQIPQVVATSETEITDSNVESKDAGAANESASRKKSNRKTLFIQTNKACQLP
jgi:hypothetical protein